jgi:hypothetical protein
MLLRRAQGEPARRPNPRSAANLDFLDLIDLQRPNGGICYPTLKAAVKAVSLVLL